MKRFLTFRALDKISPCSLRGVLISAAALFVLSTPLIAAPPAIQQTPEDLFKAGAMAFQTGDYASAAKNFETILAMEPTGDALDTLLFTLGSTYYSLKDFSKAEEDYKRDLKEFPQGKNKTKALLAISQIQLQTGRKEEAEETLRQAGQGSGDLAAQAKLAYASLLIDNGKAADASTQLHLLVDGGITSQIAVQAAMSLAELDAKQGNSDEALHLLEQLQNASAQVDNPLELDHLGVKIGDSFLAAGDRKKALRMYALVRPKAVLVTLQKDRIAVLEKQIAANRATLQTNPKAFLEINATNAALASNETALKKVLDQVEKLPDTFVPVRLREAKAYDAMDEKWETILIWESLLDCGDPQIREEALFSIGAAYVSLGRVDDATTALDKYLSEFPTGKYASQAGYLKGAVELQAGDFSKAESYFGARLSKGGGGDSSNLAEEMQFLLANSQFAQGDDPATKEKYKDAIVSYQAYLTKYPSGKYAEESSFRIPYASFQYGDYSNALAGFQDYAKKYPSGQFLGDVEYRIALCYYAANQYDEALKLCAAWEAKHSGELMEAEVLALEGDLYAAKEMPAESAAAYRKSVDLGTTDELLKYSLFEANKQYQKLRRWDEIATMFSDFAKNHPESPEVVIADFWVSKAKIKEGKSEEAKQYLADTILRVINDRKKDSVEQLISLLAQTCSKRPRPTFVPLVDSTAASSPTPAPAQSPTNQSPINDVAAAPDVPAPSPTPLPPYDPVKDFSKYLNTTNVGTEPLAVARLHYGQAELAGFTKNPDLQKQLMASISQLPVDLLSAKLLAECGELALKNGDPDKAEPFYKELISSFSKSDLLEYAYDGMGEIALDRNKPDEALVWFDDAITKLGAEATLAQVTYGKGKALLALGKLDEAQKIFETVAGTKEWRGEVTAEALLSLGDLYEKRGNPAAAIQYYQRVFVAYQRYPDLVITAYFKAADAFVELNQPEKAAAHLREMLGNPRLAQSPRADEARKKLESLPAADQSQPAAPSSGSTNSSAQ